ncbi:hypothetical protein RJT34_02876 [Clitoria ternatea]|uniref:Uncharacterized protein n=1 Tax=Clitoria ternatea TaxID=43366 RepID=A0AAN9KIQ7_CLITE
MWKEIVAEFGLQGDEWVSQLYEKRCMSVMHFREIEADYNLLKGTPVPQSPLLALEKSAWLTYKVEVFNLFRGVLSQAGNCTIVRCNTIPSLYIYVVNKFDTAKPNIVEMEEVREGNSEFRHLQGRYIDDSSEVQVGNVDEHQSIGDPVCVRVVIFSLGNHQALLLDSMNNISSVHNVYAAHYGTPNLIPWRMILSKFHSGKRCLREEVLRMRLYSPPLSSCTCQDCCDSHNIPCMKSSMTSSPNIDSSIPSFHISISLFHSQPPMEKSGSHGYHSFTNRSKNKRNKKFYVVYKGRNPDTAPNIDTDHGDGTETINSGYTGSHGSCSTSASKKLTILMAFCVGMVVGMSISQRNMS